MNIKTYIHTYMNTYIHTYTHIHTYIHTCIYVYACMQANMYVRYLWRMNMRVHLVSGGLGIVSQWLMEAPLIK